MCKNNHLNSLKGTPLVIPGTFNCQFNPILTQLQKGPNIVEGDYDCSYCDINTLKGSNIDKVGNNFICHNNKLKTLDHGPRLVQKDYLCYKNPLLSQRPPRGTIIKGKFVPWSPYQDLF